MRQTGGASQYAGNLPEAHRPLGLEPRHFEMWLELWAWNCRRNLRDPEASELVERASSIAVQLRRLLSSGAWFS